MKKICVTIYFMLYLFGCKQNDIVPPFVAKEQPACSIQLNKTVFAQGEEIRVCFSTRADTTNHIFSSLLEGKGILQILSRSNDVVHKLQMYPIAAPKVEEDILIFYHRIPGRAQNLEIQEGVYSIQVVLGNWQSDTVGFQVK